MIDLKRENGEEEKEALESWEERKGKAVVPTAL